MVPALFAVVAAAAPVVNIAGDFGEQRVLGLAGLNISGDVEELRVSSEGQPTVCAVPCWMQLQPTTALRLEEPAFRTTYSLALELPKNSDVSLNFKASPARRAGRAMLGGGSKLLLGGAALIAIALPLLVVADRTAPGNDASAPLVIGAATGGLGLVTFGLGFLSVSVGAPLYLAGDTDIVVRR